MTDWDSERVKALVEAAENSVQRTRWVFLVLNLGCAVIIAAQLNLYGTWVRNVRERAEEIIQKDERAEQAAQTEQEKKRAEQIKKEDIEVLRTIDKILWDDLYTVSMPLLGIKYSADDLIILGTASMSVLALWFVYAHRRENHCINDLREIAINAKTTNPALASYIYYAIAHHFVFTTTQNETTPGSQKTKKVRVWHVAFLTHLPWIASLIVVFVMALSLFVAELKLVLVVDEKVAAFPQLKPFEQFESILRMSLGFAFTLLTMNYCFEARGHDRQTKAYLWEMKQAASSNPEPLTELTPSNQEPIKTVQRKKKTKEKQPRLSSPPS